jgi:hypothetical protein
MTQLLKQGVKITADWFINRRHLWNTIIVVQVVFFLGLSAQLVHGGTEGDLQLYRHWVVIGLNWNFWPGLDYAWVYPIGALVPMALSGVFGPSFFLLTWLTITAALNIASFAVIIGPGTSRRRIVAAWWWLAILFVLSPVALLRLEGITAPLAIMALFWIGQRPIVAGTLLAIATWIKIWPAAIFIAVLASMRRWRPVIFAGAVTSACVVLATVMLGGAANLFSFLSMQSNRNLQIEAPIATPWMWLSILHVPGFEHFYSTELETWEVVGPGASFFAAIMTPLMVLVVAGIVVMLFIARRRGADSIDAVLAGSLAIATAMIVFNKVGSPQYMLWVTPIVAVGLAMRPRAWSGVGVLTGVIALMTTLIFPIFYMPLVEGSKAAMMLLTCRNILTVALFAWAVYMIYSMMRKPLTSADLEAELDVNDEVPAPRRAVGETN